MEGMEPRLLCDVIVVLNIAAFLHQWVFLGNGTGELARSAVGNFCLFFAVFCPIAGLRCSIMKFKIIGTASFLSTSWRSLEEDPNKLVTKRFCSKLSSVKCFTQTHECFEGMKHSLFMFVSHFWVLGEVLTLDFEWFSSEGQIFRISWAHQQWRHKFYFPKIVRQFSRPL